MKTLMEDFRRLGLTKEQSQSSLEHMMGESVQDADEESDALDVINHYKTEGVGYMKKTKLRGLKGIQARKNRKKAGAKKSQRKSAKRQAKKAKTGAWQAGSAAIQGKVKKKSSGRTQIVRVVKGMGRKRHKVQSWREYDGSSISEDLIQNLQMLAESMSVDPEERFTKYVEAFNHIADLGELLTLRYHEMEAPQLATEMALIATRAEQILESMEEMDGACDSDEDATLESILADAMEDVNTALQIYGEVLSEDEDESDDEDLEEQDGTDADGEDCSCDEADDNYDEGCECDYQEEDVEGDPDDEEIDEDVDRLSLMIEAAKKAAKKVAKSKGKSKGKKGSKLSAYEKQLGKRKDVRDPDALGGWLDKHHGVNRKTGKPRIK